MTDIVSCIVRLTHLDNVDGNRFALACVHLSRPLTGLSVLHMIDSPCDVFDPEVEQHKSADESCEKRSHKKRRNHKNKG